MKNIKLKSVMAAVVLAAFGSIFLTSCGERQEKDTAGVPGEEEAKTLPAQESAVSGSTSGGRDADEKEAEGDISADFLEYSGYLDESPWWDDVFREMDYDSDGKRDRVFRRMEEQDDGRFSYGIAFGDGTVLEFGPFEDPFQSISLDAADMDGDGSVELLYVGMHTGATNPLATSEIMMFRKTGEDFTRLDIPKPYQNEGEDSGFANTAGVAVAGYSEKDHMLRLENEEYGYQEIVPIPESNGSWSPEEGEVVAAESYFADITWRNGEYQLVLVENLGDKNVYFPLGAAFAWKEGRFIYREMSADLGLEYDESFWREPDREEVDQFLRETGELLEKGDLQALADQVQFPVIISLPDGTSLTLHTESDLSGLKELFTAQMAEKLGEVSPEHMEIRLGSSPERGTEIWLRSGQTGIRLYIINMFDVGKKK